MAKLRCPCGELLSNVQCPNEIEGFLITDQDMGFEYEKSCIDLLDISRAVWECGTCGRLAFNFPGREDSTVKWYVPENGRPGHLMRFQRKND